MIDPITLEDLNNLIKVDFIDWGKLKDSSVLVTGATGQIGSEIVKLLLFLNEKKALNINIIALIRNIEKAKSIFKDFLPKMMLPKSVIGGAVEQSETEGADCQRRSVEGSGILCNAVEDANNSNIIFLCQDITESIKIEENVDFIIHTANSTTSKDFITKPVEILDSIYSGTKNILEFAKSKSVKSLVYLSSMEVYGTPNDEKKIYEKDIGKLDSMSLRNSYPIGKLVAENLCVSEYSEYKLPVKIIRLTQTIGGTISPTDNRVWADFARKSAKGENIVLHTKGETKRNYLYITDATSAIFTILLYGENGQAYSAANEDTYCSISEMANLASSLSKDGKTKVVFEFLDDSVTGYQAVKKIDLSSEKLQKLGWKPSVNLKTTYTKMIKQLNQLELSN